MKLKPISNNVNLLSFGDNIEILFSYNMPVAGFYNGYFRTNTFHSVTTSKHINKYLDGMNARTIKQSELDQLMERVTLS